MKKSLLCVAAALALVSGTARAQPWQKASQNGVWFNPSFGTPGYFAPSDVNGNLQPPSQTVRGGVKASIGTSQLIGGIDTTGTPQIVTPDSTIRVSGGTIGLPSVNTSGAGTFSNITVDGQGRITAVRGIGVADVSGALPTTDGTATNLTINGGNVPSGQILAVPTAAPGTTGNQAASVDFVSAATASKANSADPSLTGDVNIDGSILNSIATATTGHFDPAGSLSWDLGGSGFFTSESPSIPVVNVTGTHSVQTSPPYINPDLTNSGRAQVEINTLASNPNNGESALNINFDVGTMLGTGTNPDTQKTAEQIGVWVHPGTGSQPISAWVFNPDILCNGAAGTVALCINSELDYNYDYSGSAFSVLEWHNHSLGYTATADTYMSTSYEDAFTGVATISGNTLTATTPDSRGFSALSTHDVVIGGKVYSVASVQSATQLTLTTQPGNNTGVAYTWYPVAVNFGILMTNTSNTRFAGSADVQLNDSAYDGIGLQGNHVVGIDLSQDTASYGLLLHSSQNLCLAGVSACMSSNSSGTLVSLSSGLNLTGTAFSSGSNTASYFIAQNLSGGFKIIGSGEPTDENNSQIGVSDASGTISFKLLNDALSSGNSYMDVSRTGYVPTLVTFSEPISATAYKVGSTAGISKAAGTFSASTAVFSNGILVSD